MRKTETASRKLEHFWVAVPSDGEWSEENEPSESFDSREQAEQAARDAGWQFVSFQTLQIDECEDIEASRSDVYQVGGDFVTTRYDGAGALELEARMSSKFGNIWDEWRDKQLQETPTRGKWIN